MKRETKRTKQTWIRRTDEDKVQRKTKDQQVGKEKDSWNNRAEEHSWEQSGEGRHSWFTREREQEGQDLKKKQEMQDMTVSLRPAPIDWGIFATLI